MPSLEFRNYQHQANAAYERLRDNKRGRKKKRRKKKHAKSKPTIFKGTYAEYLKSPQWKRKCKEAKKRAGGKCEECGTTKSRFEVHHKTYERLFNEKPLDLAYLCYECHSINHENKHTSRDSLSVEFRQIARGF